MGSTNDTVTRMLERWYDTYGDLIDELTPAAREAFDRLRAQVHKHSAALNRHPVIDYERPLMLVLVVDLQRQIQDLERQVAQLKATPAAG